MTEAQLDKVEDTLGLKLPADYRAVSREFPFRRIGNEEVYWFYDDPDEVIWGTRDPMSPAGNYDKANWKPTYLLIGHGAAGDEHLIDTALAHSPVYLLSHEDHSIVEEWASLSAFVEDWNKETEQAEWQEADNARRRRIEEQKTRKWGLVILILILLSCVLVALMIRSPHSTRRSRREAQHATSTS